MVFKTARKEGRVDTNPTEDAERPTVRQRKGIALKPVQVQQLARSFADEQARVAFLCFTLLGLRRSELQRLRWSDVDLIENRLTVADSKTETGERGIGIPSGLAEQLWQHRRRSHFQGDDELVFAHPERGTTYSYKTYRAALVRAFKKAGMDWPDGLRPCHDLRVTCGTNHVQAGVDNAKLQAILGHADFATTQRYINLAGVVFRDEAAALEQRLLGVELSTHLSESQRISHDLAALSEAE
jgi:integrase